MHYFTPMPCQHTLSLAGLNRGLWIKNCFKRPTQCRKRATNGKNPHQESQSVNYNSKAPSSEISEAITVANEMHRTTPPIFLNFGRFVPHEKEFLRESI